MRLPLLDTCTYTKPAIQILSGLPPNTCVRGRTIHWERHTPMLWQRLNHHFSVSRFLGLEEGPNQVILWLFGSPFEEATVHFSTCYKTLPRQERLAHFHPITQEKEHPHPIHLRGRKDPDSPLQPNL